MTLSEAIQHAARVASSRAAMPILSGVRLTSSKGELRVRATDLRVYWEGRVEGAVGQDAEFDMVIPAGVAAKIVARWRDAKLRVVDEAVEIRDASSHARLRSFADVLDWPELLVKDDATAAGEPSVEIPRAIGRVLSAASNDETRPSFCGVFLEADPARLGAVQVTATDGHRLHTISVPWSGELPPAVIVPIEGAEAISRMVAPALTIGARLVRARCGDESIWVRTVDADPLPWRQTVPVDSPLVACVNGAEIAKAVSLAAILDARVVELLCGPEAVVVRSESLELGVIESRVAVVGAGAGFDGGGGMSMSFSPRYVLDALAAITGEGDGDVEIRSGGGLEPTLWRAPGGGDEGARALCVIMPLRK